MAKSAEKKKQNPSSYDIAEELGIPVYTPSRFVYHALYCARAGKTLGVLGRPGVGKTELLAQVSEQINYQLITERLNGRDPTDMGLPYIYEDDQHVRRHAWSIPNWLLHKNDPTPEGFKGRTLFFDELPQAYPAMQNRIGEVMNEKSLNNEPMHSKVWVAWAGNFSQDKAATYPIPRQILNRSSLVVLAPSIDDFFTYCTKKKVHPIVIAFVKLFPETLDSYDADSMINCTPRSLVSLSDLLAQKPSGEDELSLYSSVIGKGYGAHFTGFMRTWCDLPKLEDIIASPDKTPVPDEDHTDYMCAIAAMLGRAMNPQNAAPLVRYLGRIPVDYCAFAIQEAVNGNVELKKSRAITDWVIKHGHVLR